jgi:hypothetical protein
MFENNYYKNCYREGIEIEFVPLESIDPKTGRKKYGKCPGEEHIPGKIDQKCRKCPYLNRERSKKR